MRAAIYIRVSSLHEAQDTSIDNQEEMLRREVENRGWELAEIYRERESGTTFRRSEMQRLLEGAGAKAFDVLLTKSISRFGRNQRELLEAIELLDENGIRFVEFEKNIDTAKDRALLGLYAWLAENESRQKSESIKLTMRSKQKKGDFIGSRCPYGYTRDPQDKNKLLPAGDITTLTVKRIYRLYIEGYGYRAIANMLTEEGVPPPEPEIYNRKGSGWSFQTIKEILTSRSYIGCTEQHKQENMSFKKGRRQKVKKDDWIVVENRHEPIIPRQQYELVQEIMAKRAGSYRRKGAATHLFSGFLRCGDCGSSLIHTSGEYICSRYASQGAAYCTRHGVREKYLEELLLEDIRSLAASSLDRKSLLEQGMRQAMKQRQGLERQLIETGREKARVERQLLSAYEDRLENIITIEQYKSISKGLEEKKLFAEKRQRELEEQFAAEKLREEMETELAARLDRLCSFERLSRSILEKLIDKMLLYEADGEKRLELYFKFDRAENTL